MGRRLEWRVRRSYHKIPVGLVVVALIVVLIRFALHSAEETPVAAPPSIATPKSEPARTQAGPPSATGAAPVRERPIGIDVTRNHLRIAASWYPAVRVAGAPAPGPGEIDLVAHVHATEGNPNGFAKGEWLPYLSIRYTLTPSDPRIVRTSTGTFRPLLAAEGPRYAARIKAPESPGPYRLTLHIAAPSLDLVGRLDDPASGVAPWWEPFEATFDGSFQPVAKP